MYQLCHQQYHYIVLYLALCDDINRFMGFGGMITDIISYRAISLRNGKVLMQNSVQGEKSSLGFIEAVHQWE